MALVKCKECGHEISSEAEKCPNCGKKPAKLSGCLIIVIIAVVGIIIAHLFGPSKNDTPTNSQPESNISSTSQTGNSTTTSEPEPDPFTKMTAAEHINEAKTDMDSACSYCYDEARKHLEAIKEQDKEYTEVKPLLKKLEQLEEKRKKEWAEIDRKREISAREKFAYEYEKKLLEEGMDVYVRAQGKDKTTLYLKYVLFSRPLIYNLVNDSNFSNLVTSNGFKKVIFTDGYDSTWTYKYN